MPLLKKELIELSRTYKLLIILLVFFVFGMMSPLTAKITPELLSSLLPEGMKHPIVFLSKFVSTCLVFTFSYLIAFITTYVYTLYFWQDKAPHLFFSAMLLWIFGILIITITLFASLLSKTSYASLLITGISVIVLYLLTFWKEIKYYNPLKLALENMNILKGALPPSEFVTPIAVTVFLICIILGGSIYLFNRKQI